MDPDRATATSPAKQSDWWATLDRQSRSARRDSLGVEDRSPLARPARRISQSVDLLEAVEALGGRWDVASDLAHVSGGAGREGTLALGGDVHRRHLLAGKKGGADIGKTKRGKGSKCMVVVDSKGIPLGVYIASASPAEVTLVPKTLATVAIPRRGPGRPRTRLPRLIADRAYDSDPLRKQLARRGIELISPHRSNRVRPATQDGRKLRRYRRRWTIERTIAWFGAFRRLIVRYERLTSMYLAFFHVACALIALRGL